MTISAAASATDGWSSCTITGQARRQGDASAHRHRSARSADPLPNIFLVDIETAPKRFRYRLIGSNLTEVLKEDLAGRCVDEMPWLFRRYAEPAYQEVFDRPSRNLGKSASSARYGGRAIAG